MAIKDMMAEKTIKKAVDYIGKDPENNMIDYFTMKASSC